MSRLVPTLLDNMNRILPKGEIVPVPLISSVTFGPPVRLEAGEARPVPGPHAGGGRCPADASPELMLTDSTTRRGSISGGRPLTPDRRRCARAEGNLTMVFDQELTWLIGGVVGLLTLATVAGAVIARLASSDRGRATAANLNARVRAWWG